MEYPSFYGLADRRFWLLALIVVAANVVIMAARAVIDVKTHPERKEGYVRLIAGSMVTLALFFSYPVIAILSGNVSSVFEFTDPARTSGVIFGFHVFWILLFIAVEYWVWFRGGLRAFATYPAIFNLPKSEAGLRLFWAGILVFFVVAALVTLTWRTVLAIR